MRTCPPNVDAPPPQIELGFDSLLKSLSWNVLLTLAMRFGSSRGSRESPVGGDVTFSGQSLRRRHGALGSVGRHWIRGKAITN